MADPNISNAAWAEKLNDEELAAALEHASRLAPKDATFYLIHQAAQRLRRGENAS